MSRLVFRTHLASYSMGPAGLFEGSKAARALRVTIHLHLVLMFGMTGVIHLLLNNFMAGRRTLYFFLLFCIYT
jgi:hypothetical protein